MRATLLSLLIVSGLAFADAPIKSISNTQLAEELGQLKRLIQARGAAQINLQQQLTDLQDELSTLRGETENHSYKIEQIIERQRELYIEIERRLANIQSSPQVAPAPVEIDSTGSDFEASSTSLTENEAYDRAVNLILQEARYDDALPEFENFISKYPNSVYIANAHYWLGQLLFYKSRFEEAKVQFNKVIAEYPDSNKRGDALLKQGTIMQKLGDKVRAKRLFEQVISEYPDSASANLARSRLANID